LYVPIPPLNIQNRIVSILSAYDALIENNKKRIRILENMAQEIYKEWFVRMRFPGHKETKFNKGLPIDWKIKLLIDVCQKVTDGTHDSPKSTTEGYYLITGSHIKNGFIDFSKAYLISSEDHYKVQQRSRLDKGDIIFSNIGTLGSCCIIDHDFEFSVKNVAIFKPKEHYFTSFLFCFLTNKTTLEQFDLVASGTSQKFLSLNYLRKFKLLVPPMELLIRFDNIVSKIIQERSLLNKSNENLLETRDLLLPRLISGKILVEDINVNAQELMEV
jgi:type I restriction enzyme S subunit